MPTTKIMFGPWRPDGGPTDKNGVLDAVNVVPNINGPGYRPLKVLVARSSLTAATTVTISDVVGGFSFNMTDFRGSPYVVVGTGGAGAGQAKLWGNILDSSGNGTPFVDLSNASVSNAAITIWNFARYGQLLITASDAVPPQKLTISTDVGTLQALGGTPPTALLVAVVRDFVVFGRTLGNGSLLQWSALGNAEDYVASATTQSDSQSIQDEGAILGLVGGEFGLILFRNAVYRMTYIGSPVIFQFDKIVSGIEFASSTGYLLNAGRLRLGYAYSKLGDNVYILTPSGLCVIRSGQVFEHLSRGVNSAYFAEQLPATVGFTNKSIVASDKGNNRIIFGTNKTAVGTPTLDLLFYYDIPTNQFTRVSLSAGFIISSAGLLQFGDNRISEVFYLDPTDGHLAVHSSLAAGNLDAMIETSDIAHNPGQKSFVRAVRPLTNHAGTTGSPMIQVGTKLKYNQSISFSATVTVNNQGETPQRASGRLHRYRSLMSISASWSTMMGIEVEFEPDGER